MHFSSSTLVLGAVLIGCAVPAADSPSVTGSQAQTTAVTGQPMPTAWPNRGSQDCVNHRNSDPSIYKYKYDENTFILRENKCLNYEANFIYVLFGHDKVLIQDTGSIPQGYSQAKFTQEFPLRDTVEGIIGEWLTAHPNTDGSARTRDTMELLVTHSHSHGDHTSGDYQFKQANGQPYPHTQIAGLRPADLTSFFHITAWPGGQGSIDLGNRVLDVLPIPGHENSHVAVYDHGSRLLLSGDSLYPGHLFVQSWGTYRSSMQRLNSWTKETDASGAALRPIAYILGNHIEKSPTPGQFYPYPSWIQEPERKLELSTADLELLAQQVTSLGPNSPGREIMFDNFAIDAR